MVSNHYYSGESEPNMISGFLIAMANFAERIMGEAIQEIVLDQHLIIYKIIRPILVAIVITPQRATKRKLNLLMKVILTQFFEEYAGYLQEGLIEPSIFSEFRTSLDNILKVYFTMKQIK
ncbi:MAG: hypothetical protein ACW97Z_00710 [Candidatus Hodarchaeales archaeon]